MRRFLLLLLASALLWAFPGGLSAAQPCRPLTLAPSQIPAEAHRVLAHVRSTGQALPGYEGGRRFGNYGGGGEQKLPASDARGKRISYREWDIHPRVPSRNRGPERLVTGSDGRAWFTADHYCSFTEMP